eukprot:TRINITY_DN15008_c0_g1_i5.p2 TRINITY_DN15008_c0_g1~~TRINITY_DN15008_c0_g1_i5.p2  ORF type:complete len:155 (-),score=24.51 TRINITY_DN15008_c0_g1_i5:206-670(-)
MVAVSVRVGGAEVVRVDQRSGRLKKDSTLFDVSNKNTSGALDLQITRESVFVSHVSSAFNFTIASEPTGKPDTKNSHQLNVRLGQGIVLTSPASGDIDASKQRKQKRQKHENNQKHEKSETNQNGGKKQKGEKNQKNEKQQKKQKRRRSKGGQL